MLFTSLLNYLVCTKWTVGVEESRTSTVTQIGGWLYKEDKMVLLTLTDQGFGDLKGEFWYGLRAIGYFTQTRQWELKIDFEFDNKTRSYLQYNIFKVGDVDNLQSAGLLVSPLMTLILMMEMHSVHMIMTLMQVAFITVH